MLNNQLRSELEINYSYGDSSYLRYTHGLRIYRIRQLINNFSNRNKNKYYGKALDAGCSFGVYSILLAEAGYKVDGIDISNEDIERARDWVNERGLENNISLQVGDIQKINCEDSTYDLIVCSEVLEHLENPIFGARELYRVLKNNGTVIISMPNIACLFGVLQWAYRKSGIRSLLGKPPLNLHQIQHSRYYFGNIIKLLKNAGFKINFVCSTSHIPFIWGIDSFIKRYFNSFLLETLDRSLGDLPILKYFGFNFIVVVQK